MLQLISCDSVGITIVQHFTFVYMSYFARTDFDMEYNKTFLQNSLALLVKLVLANFQAQHDVCQGILIFEGLSSLVFVGRWLVGYHGSPALFLSSFVA